MKRYLPRTLSIRTRCVVGIALLYALLIGVFVADGVQRQQQFLHKQQVEDVLGLSRGIALAGNTALLAGDIVGLQEVLAAVVLARELRYGFVVDDEGKVLAHTDRSLVGKYVADPVSLGLQRQSPDVRVLVDSPDLIDVAAPVMERGKRVGWVRIGIGLETTRHAVADMVHNGLIYALIAILVGVAFAAWETARSSGSRDGT